MWKAVTGLLLLTFVAATSSVQSSEAVFARQGVTVIESSHSVLVIEFEPQLRGWDTVYVEGIASIRPDIAGAVPQSDHAGAPPRYVIDIPISVPGQDAFALQQVEAFAVRQFDAPMTPVPDAFSNETEAGHRYRFDAEKYRQSGTKSWAGLQYRGIARDRHLATLSLLAADYDGEAQRVRLPERIRVVIRFQADGRQDIGPREQYDLSATINGRQTVDWKLAARIPPLTKGKAADEIGSARSWLRIGIDEEGIYRIDAERLRNAGLSIGANELRSLKLFGYGGRELPESVSAGRANEMIEQPLIVNTNSAGELEDIVFYAAAARGFVAENNKIKHFINLYSKRNYYMLCVGGEDGLRAAAVPAPAAQEVVHRPTSYLRRIFHEEDIRNPYSPGSGRRWFGVTVDQNIPAAFFPKLMNKLNSGEVLMRCVVAHRSSASGTFDINGNSSLLSSFTIPFVSFGGYEVARSQAHEVRLDAADVAAELKLEFNYRSAGGGNSALAYIDWFEIHYPAAMQALDNKLELFDDASRPGVTEYSIEGFSGRLYGFDVRRRARPQLLQNVSGRDGSFVFRSNVAPGETPGRYFIAGDLQAPVSLEKAAFADLRNNPANTDVIVITHRDLLASATSYREYREAGTNFSVSVRTTDEIFNEFAGGLPDPTAIRDFLIHCMEHWTTKPRYVVLWGDGHYDYRGIGSSSKNLVPTYQFLDPEGPFDAVDSTFMTEDYFVQVVGDDLEIDIAIGRIPVVSNLEAEIVLDKLRRYESQSAVDAWRSTITMIADDSPVNDRDSGDGSLHTRQSEILSGDIPGAMRQKKIYLPDYSTENIPGGRRKPKVSQDLVSAINAGTVLLNWIGHGNPRVWAHERIFEKDQTIPLMQNADKLFFLTAATCDFGRFDDSERQSGAEEMFTYPDGGSIGAFSSARTVYAHLNAAINEQFYAFLFDNSSGSYDRLGDVLFRVKQRFRGRNDRKFFLLGDPLLRLLIPPMEVHITSVDDADLAAGELPKLRALSTVEIEGYVSLPGSAEADPGFDGSVLLSLYDSDSRKEVVDSDNSTHRYSVLGGLLNVSGAQVRGGRFSTSIVVPQDISFSNDSGRLFAYAFDEDRRRFAKGSSKQFTVGGVNTTIADDEEGPEIDIFLDTRSFKAGDFVNPIPLLIVDLFDETGVNATGLGIGHDIQAWIDDEAQGINLTKSYSVSLVDFRKGTVEQELFNLACGRHSLRVRAWDVFNNYSESETYFQIPCGATPVLDEVYNYPNPFSGETRFSFRHSELEPVATELQIYSADARLVRTLHGEVNTRSATVPWDGRDGEGNILPNGSYHYRLLLRTESGASRSYTGQLMLLR